jgi:hypothetical protein
VATLDDVRELALALPATTERSSYGTQGFRVKDRLFARSREDDVLVVWVADLGEKEMLVRFDPEKFFTVPHYDGHASVLVRLSAVDRGELGELLADAWRARAPKRLLADLDHQPIFRAPMRARDLDLPPGAGADVGLAHDLVGIGDVADRAVARFAELPDGAFVWTRSSDGLFHLGRIAGACVDGVEAALAVGLRHVRPATWLDRPLREDEVPSAVAATFARGGRNLQRTHDDDAERLTAELWASGGPPRP